MGRVVLPHATSTVHFQLQDTPPTVYGSCTNHAYNDRGADMVDSFGKCRDYDIGADGGRGDRGWGVGAGKYTGKVVEGWIHWWHIS